MDPTVLSIDIGTSRTKAVVSTADGRIIGRTEGTYPLKVGPGGKAEQDPAAWVRAVTDCVRRIAAACEAGWPPSVCSVTGQMHGLVLLDRRGKVLRDALICSDFRASEELVRIEGEVSPDRVLRITGSPGLAMFPGPKLLWVQHHEPQVYGQIGRILMPKDYIGFVMTGEIATDPSDASGTMMYNIQQNRWDEDLCRASGASVDFLPPVLPATEMRGNIQRAFARRSGIPEGTPVIVGGGDLPTTVIGAGLVDDRAIGISLGTAGIVFRLASRLREELLGRIFHFRHAVSDGFVSMGSQPGTGFSLNWFEKQVLHRRTSKIPEGDYVAIAEEVSLFFLPFLLGTGSPYMNYRPQGAFLGLSFHHNRADLRLAILQGISYSLRQSFELLNANKAPVNKIVVCAGGSYNQAWLQVLSEILGCPLTTLGYKDTAVVGASILGGLSCGWYNDLEEGVKRFVRPETVIEPRNEHIDVYERAYRKYLEYCQELRAAGGASQWPEQQQTR